MSSATAAPRAAGPVSNARAEASRQNGAKSRGPKTPEGKARAAQNALKHGMRARKHLVLPDEDAAEFADLEAALVAELAPVGALQTVLARRVAVAAWRLARADRIEIELFEERRVASGGLGLALIRDGNGARSLKRCCAIAARQWPSSGARCARSRRCRPKGRSRPTPPRRRSRSGPQRGHGSPIVRNRTTRARPGPTAISPERAARVRRAHQPAVPWRPNEPERSADPRLEAASAGSPVTPAAAVRSGDALATRRR